MLRFKQCFVKLRCDRYPDFLPRLELLYPDALVPHIDILPLEQGTILQTLTSEDADGIDDADFRFVLDFVHGVSIRENRQYLVFLFLRERLTMHDLPLFLTLPSPQRF